MRALAAMSILLLSTSLVQGADPPGRRTALEGQCALGWVYGHRILTDCSITWLDPHDGHTYCFTTRIARERFMQAASENVKRARQHFRTAGESSVKP